MRVLRYNVKIKFDDFNTYVGPTAELVESAMGTLLFEFLERHIRDSNLFFSQMISRVEDQVISTQDVK